MAILSKRHRNITYRKEYIVIVRLRSNIKVTTSTYRIQYYMVTLSPNTIAGKLSTLCSIHLS